MVPWGSSLGQRKSLLLTDCPSLQYTVMEENLLCPSTFSFWVSGSTFQIFPWASRSSLSGLEASWSNEPHLLPFSSLGSSSGSGVYLAPTGCWTDRSDAPHTHTHPPTGSLLLQLWIFVSSVDVLSELSACTTNSPESMTTAECEINVHFTIQTTFKGGYFNGVNPGSILRGSGRHFLGGSRTFLTPSHRTTHTETYLPYI